MVGERVAGWLGIVSDGGMMDGAGLGNALLPPLTPRLLQVKLMALKDQLMAIEMEAVEVLDGLVQEFDRAYSELAEINKGQYNGYFTQVRGEGERAASGRWNRGLS